MYVIGEWGWTAGERGYKDYEIIKLGLFHKLSSGMGVRNICCCFQGGRVVGKHVVRVGGVICSGEQTFTGLYVYVVRWVKCGRRAEVFEIKFVLGWRGKKCAPLRIIYGTALNHHLSLNHLPGGAKTHLTKTYLTGWHDTPNGHFARMCRTSRLLSIRDRMVIVYIIQINIIIV